MAIATATLTVNGFPKGEDFTQRNEVFYGNVALLPGGTYPNGGIPLNWLAMVDPSGAKVLPASTDNAPFQAWFSSVAASGFSYVWNKATSTLHIQQGGAAVSSPQVDIAAGAVVPTDTIQFEAIFTAAI